MDLIDILLSRKLNKGSGSGGTTNYLQLTNKPKINNVELLGALSLTDIGAATKNDIDNLNGSRVQSLNATTLSSAQTIEAVGIPVYVGDVTQYPEYNLIDTGWYIFARITAKSGFTVGSNTSVTGAAAAILTPGLNYIDVAIRFEVAASSKTITIDWGDNEPETFVFKATDLAIRNLDYRVTFYVYDVEEKGFVTWEYDLTTDTTFAAGKHYYTKDANNEYHLAEVIVGEAIPADTYYKHTRAIFEGMVRNITYVCNTPIDCPITFNLPAIEDETHGCWVEIRCLFEGTYSMTLVPPSSDIKVATEHTQQEQKGINMIDLHYTSISGTKVWRFMNTRSTVPA